MMAESEKPYGVCDIIIGVLVFGLPLTLFFPEFSMAYILPKFYVSRCHVVQVLLSWYQLDGLLVAIFLLLSCMFLEIRRRRLDETADNVLNASLLIDAAVKQKCSKQGVTLSAFAELLEASSKHYESLTLLKDDLRRRKIMNKIRDQPPTIELSSTELAGPN